MERPKITLGSPPRSRLGLPAVLNSQDQIDRLCEHLRSEGIFGLDTEFIQELTYYPVLEIIQVATDSEVCILDYQADYNFSEFMELLFDPNIKKIMHAGSSDIALFFCIAGKTLANVFDTQIAAAFLGKGSQIGYANLVRSLCHHTLSKSQTRSDWSVRPLRQEQIQYALEDVIYLPTLCKIETEMLEGHCRIAWALEEMQLLENPQRYQQIEPHEAGDRLCGSKRMTPRAKHILDCLATWREHRARQLNQRPRRVIRDDILLETARIGITDPGAIAALRHRKNTKPDRIDHQLAELVTDALNTFDHSASHHKTPPPQKIQDENFNTVRLLLSTHVKIRSQELGIAPNYLAKNELIEDLMTSFVENRQQESQILQGWRREAIGNDLLNLLSGKVGLRICFENSQLGLQLEL